jgi:thiol-disulfide isomerase/thioredoxin
MAPGTDTQASSAGKLVRYAEPQAMPDLAFTAADGTQHHLSEWRGKVVLLNLWATWCAPCKAEMPALDRLQAKLGSDAFTVLAISLDRTGPDKPAAFFAGNGITHLTLYMDRAGGAAASLGASGLPLSAVLDRHGNEVARLTGPAEWDSAAMAAQIEQLIKAGAG